MLNKKGENKMWNILEKKKLILTEWDNSPESKKNFKKAIKKLKAENNPFNYSNSCLAQRRQNIKSARELTTLAFCDRGG